jgi:hypothetical protein
MLHPAPVGAGLGEDATNLPIEGVAHPAGEVVIGQRGLIPK